MNPELIQRTQHFLFASEEEMQQANLPRPVQQRLLRLRDIYNYWLANPRLTDKAIVSELRDRYHLGLSIAYEDLRLIKVCLGNLNQCTTDYYRYLFLQRAEEAFAMARANNDTKAFAATLATLGKYTRLDAPDGSAPDYSLIVPQSFEITADPASAGFKRIPNVEEKARRLLARYITEAQTTPAPEAQAEEIKPITRKHDIT